MRRVAAVLIIPLLAAALAACSGGTGTRTIDVRMFDDMRYDPDSYDVNAGETVTFAITNAGQARHEFFIGTVDEHSEHADQMREDDHGDEAHADPAALSLDGGDSGSLTYTFDEPGEMLVGCHEPGHYEAGMVAPVTVHPAS